ncbi:MAG: ATP-binding protein [Cyclobacteriaceae bacterium]
MKRLKGLKSFLNSAPSESVGDSESLKKIFEGDIHPELLAQYEKLSASSGRKSLAQFLKAINTIYQKADKEREELNIANERQKAQREIMNKAFDDAKKQNAELVVLKEKSEAQKEVMRKAYEELKDTHGELKNAQEQLVFSEKMASLGQLVSGIAHEINTPLSVINGGIQNLDKNMGSLLQEFPVFMNSLSKEGLALFSKMIEKTTSTDKQSLTSREERKIRRQLVRISEENDFDLSDDDARGLIDMGIHENMEEFIPALKEQNDPSFLTKITQLGKFSSSTGNMSIAVDKMKKIVFSLKNYAHHGSSDEAIQTNVIKGIETILTLYFNQIKQGIELTKNYNEDEELFIMGYPDELDQVWTNLISNAIQAMNLQGTLLIDIQKKEKNIIVKIEDNGPGIPEELMTKVFQPFFTTKPQGEGSGLGLSICKKIVEKHHGTMDLESEAGKTVFTIVLPSM